MVLHLGKLIIFFWNVHSLSYIIALNCLPSNYNLELLTFSTKSLISLQATLYKTTKKDLIN